MTNRDKIEEQKSIVPGGVTKKLLDSVQSKTYHSGAEIKVGDHVLFGFLETDDNLITLIKFHEEEYGTVYVDSSRRNDNETIPNLKLKTQI